MMAINGVEAEKSLLNGQKSGFLSHSFQVVLLAGWAVSDDVQHDRPDHRCLCCNDQWNLLTSLHSKPALCTGALKRLNMTSFLDTVPACMISIGPLKTATEGAPNGKMALCKAVFEY